MTELGTVETAIVWLDYSVCDVDTPPQWGPEDHGRVCEWCLYENHTYNDATEGANERAEYPVTYCAADEPSDPTCRVWLCDECISNGAAHARKTAREFVFGEFPQHDGRWDALEESVRKRVVYKAFYAVASKAANVSRSELYAFTTAEAAAVSRFLEGSVSQTRLSLMCILKRMRDADLSKEGPEHQDTLADLSLQVSKAIACIEQRNGAAT